MKTTNEEKITQGEMHSNMSTTNNNNNVIAVNKLRTWLKLIIVHYDCVRQKGSWCCARHRGGKNVKDEKRGDDGDGDQAKEDGPQDYVFSSERVMQRACSVESVAKLTACLLQSY